ncbi:MazG nucleotide pyrophosphohydrolase domain-containing protein [Tuwongella immobilis]
MSLADIQRHIELTFGANDRQRGIDGTFMWFLEEVGELAGALRGRDAQALAMEFADVQVWLATLANLSGVDLTAAVAQKYGAGCPGCGGTPCRCGTSEKP